MASYAIQKSSNMVLKKTFDLILEKRGYTLNETIGSGCYAKVKIAEYKSKNGEKKTIAAKIIDKRKAPKDFLTKFLPRELEIYLKLDHPNIVRVYEIIEVINKTFIFMELAEGGDLLEYIKNKGYLNNDSARPMFSELAQAIKYCHTIQIAHRDLKCENVLLDKNNHVKLADFGFGRSCVDKDTNKRILSQTYCGSAAYAAPEILQGIAYNPKLYDIWSLGCILYIMVCGSIPFNDSNIKEMIKVQLEGRIRYPSKMVNKIDPIVKDLISKMLEPDVTKRANIDKVLKHAWVHAQENLS